MGFLWTWARKEEHTSLFLCGWENCVGKRRFYSYVRHGVTQAGAEILWGKKRGGSMCLFLDIVFLEKKEVPGAVSLAFATEPRRWVSSVRGPRNPMCRAQGRGCGVEPFEARWSISHCSGLGSYFMLTSGLGVSGSPLLGKSFFRNP